VDPPRCNKYVIEFEIFSGTVVQTQTMTAYCRIFTSRIAEHPFQIAEHPFQIAKHSFQIAKRPFQKAKRPFQIAKRPFK
jgi:hypothetical protein